MILEFINSDGTFYKNVGFIGYVMKVYTNGIPDPLTKISNICTRTYKIIWRFK